MEIGDVLRSGTADVPELRAPVMLVALRGWFDVGSTATAAVEFLVEQRLGVTVAEVDPDPFYDFTQERPMVEVHDGAVRTIRWPENRFEVSRGDGRDLVVLAGTEPHLHWRTYTGCVVAMASRLGCEAVVTVGAAAEAVPHTRPPIVTGSTTNQRLASQLGLAAPTYQGMTGVAGVLQADLEHAGIPAVSLRVGIPHYLMNAEHPQAVSALQTHLAHVLGVPATGDLSDEISRWRSLHDEVAENDLQLALYVQMLEQEYDRRAEASIPTADDLGDRFEQFLRDQRDDD